MPLVLDGTNGVSGVDGTASNPAIEGTDSNTGIFYPAADTVAIGTGGTEALRVNSSQNVGIGTSSPSGRLHVAVTTTGDTSLSLQRIGSSRFEFQQGIVGVTGDALFLKDTTLSRDYLALRDGNVGIGTSSPNARLHVSNSSNGASVDVICANTYYGASSTDEYASFQGEFYQNDVLANRAAGYVRFGKSGDFASNANASAYLAFATRNAGTLGEKMRIDSSGNVGIGTSSPATMLVVAGTVSITGGTLNGSLGSPQLYRPATDTLAIATGATERARITSGGDLLLNSTNATTATMTIMARSGGSVVGFRRNSSTYGSDTQVGSISCDSTSTAYNTSSDYRLKENIQPMTGALAKLAALKPCTYTWKEGGSDGEGFIAHELQEIVPQCVTGEKDAVDAEGNPIYQGVDTSFLVATLTAAIQELNAKVEAQAAEIAALKGNA